MIIYISHPYQNKKENKIKIENIIKELVKEHPEHTFISPVHTFGFMYEDVEYEVGLGMCLKLLNRCDYMLVFGDWENSRGCKAEIEYARVRRIPYQIKGLIP